MWDDVTPNAQEFSHPCTQDLCRNVNRVVLAQRSALSKEDYDQADRFILLQKRSCMSLLQYKTCLIAVFEMETLVPL